MRHGRRRPLRLQCAARLFHRAIGLASRRDVDHCDRVIGFAALPISDLPTAMAYMRPFEVGKPWQAVMACLVEVVG